MSTNEKFIGHLKKQLGFLERSCRSYDEGYIDEGVRIAAIIRILVHNTGQSTSLLKHLNAMTIDMLSTTSKVSPQAFMFVGMGIMEMGCNGNSYFPQLGDGPFHELSPVNEWWDQVVMVIDGEPISRKKIVLAAANKDGGAHVDSKLTKAYEALSKDGAVGSLVYVLDGKKSVTLITNAHLVSLRQMAYEILNTPGILSMVNS